MKKLLFYIIIFTITVILLETLAFFSYFIYSGKFPNEYLIKIPKKEHSCDQTLFDLDLSVIHNDKYECKIKDGKHKNNLIYYEKNINSKKTILTLGGSTTDGYIKSKSQKKYDIPYYNWPYWLSKSCRNLDNYNCSVINGGYRSYSSTKERKKLIRSLMTMKVKPHIVISLNGINDILFYEGISVLEYPYYDERQLLTLVSMSLDHKDNLIIFPNTIKLTKFFLKTILKKEFNKDRLTFQNINSQIKKDYESSLQTSQLKENEFAKIWKFNVSIMHSISEKFGIKYLVFLQPTMGLEDEKLDNMSDSDKKIRKSSFFTEEWRNGKSYIELVRFSYKSLKKECSELDFCIDISSLLKFDGTPLYTDERHPNGKGNQIISNRILEELVNRNLLN